MDNATLEKQEIRSAKPRKRRFGDRKDGRLVRTLYPMNKFMPYIMRTRNDACNQFSDSIDLTETDPYIKNLWEENLSFEITHLHRAVELLKKYTGKEWQEVIPDGEFPAPISLHENVEYVRKILDDTVQFTNDKEDYIRVKDLPQDADFFRYQNIINPNVRIVPSHCVIEQFIRGRGMDYRYQVAPSPIPELRNRRDDNTDVGRKPNATKSTNFFCND